MRDVLLLAGSLPLREMDFDIARLKKVIEFIALRRAHLVGRTTSERAQRGVEADAPKTRSFYRQDASPVRAFPHTINFSRTTLIL